MSKCLRNTQYSLFYNGGINTYAMPSRSLSTTVILDVKCSPMLSKVFILTDVAVAPMLTPYLVWSLCKTVMSMFMQYLLPSLCNANVAVGHQLRNT